MKKHITLLILFLLSMLALWAQAPHVLHYQGVLKNPDGSVRSETEAFLAIEVLQQGEVVYAEEHNIFTNKMGYFSIDLGAGYATTGDFGGIDWSLSPTTIRTLLDGEEIAETSLASVPYALYANKVEGLDALTWRVDTLYQGVDSLSLRVDTLSLDIDTLSFRVDTLSLGIDSLSHLAMLQGMQITQLDSLITLYNVSQAHPLSAGIYYNDTTARQVVPADKRRAGMVLTFRNDTLSWRSIQFVYPDTAYWDRSEAWQDYGSYASQMAQIDSALARLDSLNNVLESRLEALSQQEAWCFTSHNELFSQVGYIDYNGMEVVDFKWVHTPLIPISQQWVITTYCGSGVSGISFYRDADYSSRIPVASDSIIGVEPEKTVVDMAQMEIPAGAQYFSVNMPLLYRDEVTLQERTALTPPDANSATYYYSDLSGSFAYIGAYVDYTGTRHVASRFRHSRFLPIGSKRYRAYSTGCYMEQSIAPVIIYFSEPQYSKVVGYDLGQVSDNGTTFREIIVSKESAPEGAEYFILNWIPTMGGALVQEGASAEEALIASDKRLLNLESNQSCYTSSKMVTIGDSFTSNTGNKLKMWQEYLVDWMGMNWSKNETLLGSGGHAAMGYGGSWILPNDINSFSIRGMDVKYYSPSLILIYGGQNDKLGDLYKMGTIDDEPFIPSQVIDLAADSTITTLAQALQYIGESTKTERKAHSLIHLRTPSGKKIYYLVNDTAWDSTDSWVIATDTITFYAAYKGLVQRFSTEMPKASIYCLTLMQCDYSQLEATAAEIEEIDALRRRKCEIIKEIARYYGVQIIDLWNEAGVTPYNASALCDDWLHPNSYGYRKLAECVYRILK